MVINMQNNKYAEVCECMHANEGILKKINDYMPEEEELYDLADLFKMFSDSTRIKILYVLMCSEMCVCDIAQIIGMTQSAVSHQLKTLKQMHLVKNRRDGKTVFYSLADSHIKTILSQGLEHVKEDN